MLSRWGRLFDFTSNFADAHRAFFLLLQVVLRTDEIGQSFVHRDAKASKTIGRLVPTGDQHTGDIHTSRSVAIVVGIPQVDRRLRRMSFPPFSCQ